MKIVNEEKRREELRGIASHWMQNFSDAARAKCVEQLHGLFHPQAIIFGAEKGGCIDWPIGLSFEFDVPNSKMQVAELYIFVICTWKRLSPIVGGPESKGNATLVLLLEPSKNKDTYRMLCVHAHFSELKQ